MRQVLSQLSARLRRTDYVIFPSYIRGPATAFAPPASNADGFTPEEAEFRDFHVRRAERAALYTRLTKTK